MGNCFVVCGNALLDSLMKGYLGNSMKIIASDYDGTLNHNGIDDKKREAIVRWRKAGNLFGIVSGRGIKSLLEVIENKDFEYDFLIANNGAVILDKDLNVLYETRLEGEIAVALVKDLISWGCPFANIDKAEPVMVQAKEKRNDSDFTLEDMPENIEYFNQVSTWLETLEETVEIVKKVNQKYSGVLTPLQNGTCIDIVPLGVNKANGIYSLLEVVGGKYEDVITVGDNINDGAMIKEFRSYAMENGVDYIKELADYTTLGITELIEKELN